MLGIISSLFLLGISGIVSDCAANSSNDISLANTKYTKWVHDALVDKVLKYKGMEFDNNGHLKVTFAATTPTNTTSNEAYDVSQYLRYYYFQEHQGTSLEEKLKAKASLYLDIPSSKVDLVFFEYPRGNPHYIQFKQSYLDSLFPPAQNMASKGSAKEKTKGNFPDLAETYFELVFNKYGCNQKILQKTDACFEAVSTNCKGMIINSGPERWEKIHISMFITQYTENNLHLIVDGEYSAGKAPNPQASDYRDMEPEFSENLSIFSKSLLTDFLTFAKSR